MQDQSETQLNNGLQFASRAFIFDVDILVEHAMAECRRANNEYSLFNFNKIHFRTILA